MPRLQEMFSAAEFRIPSFYRDLFIELLISMYLLMFITFSLTTMHNEIYKPSTTHIGLMVGFVIFLLIEGYGHFSGAHMNPVISLAFCIDGRITFIRATLYTIVQCIGGTIGSSLVYGLSPQTTRENFKPFSPNPTIEAGLVIEIIFTFNLVYVALSASDTSTHKAAMPSLPTAFCVGTAIMAVGTWTGACLNPIVALGPAVISKNFKDHWVYWVADYTGALAAVLLYKVYKMAKTTPLNATTEELQTKPEAQPLTNSDVRSDVAALVDKIIQVTSQHANNANIYPSDSKASLHNLDAPADV